MPCSDGRPRRRLRVSDSVSNDCRVMRGPSGDVMSISISGNLKNILRDLVYHCRKMVNSALTIGPFNPHPDGDSDGR